MTTGYIGGGKCWLTESEAIDAVFSSKGTQLSDPLYNNGIHYFYLIRHVKASGLWVEQHSACQKPFNGAPSCSTFNLPVDTSVIGTCTMQETSDPSSPSPGSDPYLSFLDGHVMGWAVVAAMAVAWGVMQLRRAVA